MTESSEGIPKYMKIVLVSVLCSAVIVVGFTLGLAMKVTHDLQVQRDVWDKEFQKSLDAQARRNALSIGAKEAGFTNNDMIWNTTKACWYKSETNQFYGDCEEEKPRIELMLQLPHKSYNVTHWSVGNATQTYVWRQ